MRHVTRSFCFLVLMTTVGCGAIVKEGTVFRLKRAPCPASSRATPVRPGALRQAEDRAGQPVLLAQQHLHRAGDDLRRGPGRDGRADGPGAALHGAPGRAPRGVRRPSQRLAPKGEKPGYRLNVANRLWGQQGYHFLPDFLALTRDYYDAELAEVDFVRQTEQARATINQWVEEQTQEKIKDLVPAGVLTP